MADESHENGTIKLNEDYLAELEEAAKGRYSEEDEDFMKVFNSNQPDPPIQPAEQFNRNRHGGRFRGNRHRGGGHRDHWQDRSGGSGGGGGGRYGGYGGGGGGGGGGRYGGYRDDRQDYGNYGSNKREWDGRRKYRR